MKDVHGHSPLRRGESCKMAESFQQNVDALFRGMENFMTSKTVVGEPVRVGDTILIPLVDVSFGMMTSSKAEPQKHNGGGGMGGKMIPSAVMVVKNGQTRILNVKNQDGFSKLLDLVPDVVNRLKDGKPDEKTKAAAEEAAKQAEGQF